MALVMAYHLEFLPPGVTNSPDVALPDGLVADTVRVTDHVLEDDTPVYAHGAEPEAAIAEKDGLPVLVGVYWPVMQDVTEGLHAGIRPEATAPVVARESVKCRSGKYDGRTYSALAGSKQLTVKARCGPGNGCAYRRTNESDGGKVVYEYIGRDPRG